VTPKDLEIWRTGALYHMVHALALVVMGATNRGGTHAWFFLVGILIFSGTLYALVLTQQRWLGAITPIGGTAFIIGWVILVFTSMKESA